MIQRILVSAAAAALLAYAAMPAAAQTVGDAPGTSGSAAEPPAAQAPTEQAPADQAPTGEAQLPQTLSEPLTAEKVDSAVAVLEEFRTTFGDQPPQTPATAQQAQAILQEHGFEDPARWRQVLQKTAAAYALSDMTPEERQAARAEITEAREALDQMQMEPQQREAVDAQLAAHAAMMDAVTDQDIAAVESHKERLRTVFEDE